MTCDGHGEAGNGHDPGDHRPVRRQPPEVTRQVRRSRHNGNSLDLVLFLNGLPVATTELKSDFTQSLGDVIGWSGVHPYLCRAAA